MLADFFTSMANQRFIYLSLWMLLAYFVSYVMFAILWHITAEIDQTCIEGVLRHNFLATYLFSLETQVRHCPSCLVPSCNLVRKLNLRRCHFVNQTYHAVSCMSRIPGIQQPFLIKRDNVQHPHNTCVVPTPNTGKLFKQLVIFSFT
jgi:hypothetical protein